MITLYGITNCSTVVKARTWLKTNGIEYTFWDYKKQGIDAEQLESWCREVGWQKVLNRSGMMWRKATDDDQAKVIDQATAIAFMLKVPTSIKRPIAKTETTLIVGFVEEEYKKAFNK